MAKKKPKNKVNLFCKVCFLDGTKKLYQFPNDLREAMFVSYEAGELKGMLNGALINVPTSTYKKGHATIHLAKITSVFSLERSQKWRTRGQFLSADKWTGNLSIPEIKFLLHDHSSKNKIRILIDLFKWKRKERKSK